MSMDYDIIIIGSGPGGYVAAIRGAQLGKKVAIVERAELGGVCLNWGCIPTKALLKSAQVYEYMSRAASYGIKIGGPIEADIPGVVARSRSVADAMSKGVSFLMNKNGIEIITGQGKLTGEGRVTVSAGGQTTEYSARHIILATGARPKEIPALPIDGKYIINSKQALRLDRIPKSLIVVGSGAIGCELAYYFATFGSKVTVVEYLPNMLPLEDEDVSKYMERSFRKLRATVMTSTSVKSANIVNGKCKVVVESKKGAQELESDMVLSAVGISSNIEELGLEDVGISVSKGKVEVDEFYRTNIAGIYAIGDIVPEPALAHVASAEAICCVERICGLNPSPIDYSVIPSCIYTSPEVASVGLTEKLAIEKGYEVRVGRFPFTASGKAAAAGNRDGFVKLISDAASGELLGAHMVGANVTEMISEITLAKNTKATIDDLLHTIHPHPTMSEAIMEAAEDVFGQAIHI